MSRIAPNPHDPPRPSWAGPILIGVLVTLALHSPVLWSGTVWAAVCLTCGCSGLPVGAVPALLALRRDPYLGAVSGFAVAFIAVGIAGVVLATVSFADWDPSALAGGEIERGFLTRLQEDGYTEEEAERMFRDVQSVSRFVPVVTAGLMALMGGLAGALAAAIAGRRRPPPPPQWGPPPTPGSPPPPA